MPLQYLDMADEALLAVVYWVAGLLSIAVLLDEGVQHILHPASSKLASWLGMLDLTVAAGPELSVGGVLAVLVMLVGGAIVVTVLAAVYQLASRFLDL